MSGELNTAQRLIVADQLARDALAENQRLERLVETMVAAANANARVVQAVEALIVQARKVSPSASMTVYVGDLEVALGRRPDSVRGIVGQNDVAAADAPQPEDAKVTPVTPNLSTAAVSHQSWCSLALVHGAPCNCRTDGVAPQPAAGNP